MYKSYLLTGILQFDVSTDTSADHLINLRPKSQKAQGRQAQTALRWSWRPAILPQ